MMSHRHFSKTYPRKTSPPPPQGHRRPRPLPYRRLRREPLCLPTRWTPPPRPSCLGPSAWSPVSAPPSPAGVAQPPPQAAARSLLPAHLHGACGPAPRLSLTPHPRLPGPVQGLVRGTQTPRQSPALPWHHAARLARHPAYGGPPTALPSSPPLHRPRRGALRPPARWGARTSPRLGPRQSPLTHLPRSRRSGDEPRRAACTARAPGLDNALEGAESSPSTR
jgi:hypothetical protein